MAKIQIYLKQTHGDCGKSELMFRLSISRRSTPRAGTGIFINTNEWDEKRQCLKSMRNHTKDALDAYAKVKSLESFILQKANSMEECDTKKLKSLISSCIIEMSNGICNVKDKQVQKDNMKTKNSYITDVISSFSDAKEHTVGKGRMKVYAKTLNFIRRMEKYNNTRYIVETVDTSFIDDFKWFFYNEHTLFEEIGDKMKPKPKYSYIYECERHIERYAAGIRSDNYFAIQIKVIKSVMRWANENGIKTNDIFKGFDMPHEVYGTPWYILPDTRNKLYEADLSSNPRIAVQRDIFVFQSLVGCRYGDMSRMTKSNVKGDYIEYIASKTATENPITIRVPLHKTAKEIIERYDDTKRTSLLPFISHQKYNDAIKQMFLLVPECDQLVTILDPKTRKERQAWLHEVASSHMCRRNLIGALKESGCPDEDICAISGHTVGSKAIARYRKISDERKKTMIDGI